MTWFTRHPGDRELNRFADGELGERDLARVSDHLARCPRCREEVALTRRMGESARAIPGPIATDEILRRALTRRAAGERVLLPTSDAGAPRRKPVTRFAPAAIAALLTLMIASLVISVRVLEADRPALRFYPERPTAGEPLRVEYRGGSLFADETHLKLRARYRTAEDRHWQLVAGILVRGDDGLFHTELQLPDSVVYAAFAVEDLDAQRLDSNNRELWDVMVHGEDGRPTLDAMMARTWDLERRDWGEAYQQTLRMTDLYPDAPKSWAARLSYEVSLFDRDSVFASHRTELERIERRLAAKDHPTPEEMAWVAFYALELRDLETATIWIDRAVSEAPSSGTVGNIEGMVFMTRHGEDPLVVLAGLQAIWERLERGTRTLAHLGWNVAQATDRPTDIGLWSQRYASLRPEEEINLIASWLAIPELRHQFSRWMSGFMQTAPAELAATRPLHLSTRTHARRAAEDLQGSLAELARMALAAGQPTAAGQLADEALGLGWRSPALLKLAEVYQDLGRMDPAMQALSRALADPAIEATAERGSFAEDRPAAWSSAMADATTGLRDHVMDEAVIRYLPDGLRFARSQDRVRLSSVLQGNITVFAFMSRYCAPAVNELRSLKSVAGQIEAMGGSVVLVSTDNTRELEGEIAEIGWNVRLYHDPTGDVREAFLSSATPDYFVVDAAGRIRFEHSRMDELARQVHTLMTLSPTRTQLMAN